MIEEADTSSTHPQCEFTQEIRLAIVMYGGVSLAIYINGVTQEFFNLVRATAPEKGTGSRALFPNNQLTSTDSVYRKLGQMLSRTDPQDERKNEGEPIRTRFVVDILSGTSAGGINGLFLAKALANNQEIKKLKELWLNEGDIDLLINDKNSAKGIFSSPQDPPKSLLDSRRMYRKLLDALHHMEASAEEGSSALSDEIDLFITATDLRGITLPLRLADKLVYERRHKSVFHFAYRSEDNNDENNEKTNDFQKDNNPFLAFAARCTSAFPFAFEPMRLADIDEVLKSLPYRDYSASRYRSDSKEWQSFFRDYPVRDDTDVPLHERSFGDGGYLDNKPFTFATEALLRRQADLPVLRKLFYIEPSPEHPEDEGDRKEKPDVLENVMAALVTLPRHETIREDLRAILDRNRLILRVNRIMSGIEEDVDFSRTAGERQTGNKWAASTDLQDMIKEKGAAYGGYHRLKVGAVTDDLSEIISRAAGFDSDSDQFLAVSDLVRAWRDASFSRFAGPNAANENIFLVRYDLSFRIRRLNFVRSKVDSILYARDAELVAINNRLNLDGREWREKDRPGFHAELLRLKGELNAAFRDLLTAKRTLWARKKNPLAGILSSIGISKDDLGQILAPASQEERLKEAGRFIKAHTELFDSFATKLAELIEKKTTPAADRAMAALSIPEEATGTPEAQARRLIRHYYECFEDYDMVTFPIMYCSEIGEPDTVDIVRISPEDATSLIDERGGDGRKKLGGTTFANFGAFLDKVWRENDIMWGRLDGAERLIAALLPEKRDEAERNGLITDAQAIIIKEELRLEDRHKLCDLLVKAITEEGEKIKDAEKLLEMIREKTGTNLNDRVSAVLRECLTAGQLREYIAKGYEVRRELDMSRMVKTLSRATIVVQKMLDDLAKGRGVGTRGMVWIARLARTVWGLLLVLIPNSIASILLQHWAKLIAVFALLVVILGFMFSKSHMWYGLGGLAIEGLLLGVIRLLRNRLGLK